MAACPAAPTGRGPAPGESEWRVISPGWCRLALAPAPPGGESPVACQAPGRTFRLWPARLPRVTGGRFDGRPVTATARRRRARGIAFLHSRLTPQARVADREASQEPVSPAVCSQRSTATLGNTLVEKNARTRKYILSAHRSAIHTMRQSHSIALISASARRAINQLFFELVAVGALSTERNDFPPRQCS